MPAMHSLRELQRDFSALLLGPRRELPAGLAVYRNTCAANYRNALGATFGVVKQLVGTPFFNVAVDAYVRAQPSTSAASGAWSTEKATGALPRSPSRRASSHGLARSPRARHWGPRATRRWPPT